MWGAAPAASVPPAVRVADSARRAFRRHSGAKLHRAAWAVLQHAEPAWGPASCSAARWRNASAVVLGRTAWTESATNDLAPTQNPWALNVSAVVRRAWNPERGIRQERVCGHVMVAKAFGPESVAFSRRAHSAPCAGRVLVQCGGFVWQREPGES